MMQAEITTYGDRLEIKYSDGHHVTIVTSNPDSVLVRMHLGLQPRENLEGDQ